MEEGARYVEHASGCAQVINEQDVCNCYLSADAEVLARTDTFQVATVQSPVGGLGRFDDINQAAIRDFVAEKRGASIVEEHVSDELYQPLRTGEIRILEIYAGQHTDGLKACFHLANVDFTHPNDGNYTRHTNHAVSVSTGRAVWYTALSYTWGVPVFDQFVSFTNGYVAITSSLANALRSLRSVETSIFVWVDQISINQSNLDEKAVQIPLMGQIYSHATNTLIWLGDEGDEDPSLAFETLETIYMRLQGSDTQITPMDFGRLSFPPVGDRSWYAINRLLRRPWFTRLWTIQEAFLSRSLFTQCGHAVASWDDFAAWCYTLQDSGMLQWLMDNDIFPHEHSDSRISSPHGALVVHAIQQNRIHGLTLVQRQPLLEALVFTRYASATEPKDKVYGLLGMAESTITPNYSLQFTTRQLYHEACVTQLPDLVYQVLSSVDHDVPLHPSWIPDWTQPRVTESLGYLTKAWTLYRAGGSPSTGPKSLEIGLGEDKTSLTLAGKIFDTIVAVSAVSTNPRLDIDSPQTANTDLVSYMDMITNETYPVRNCTVYDAFTHTLLAGRDETGASAPSAEHSEVFSLILDSSTGRKPSLPGQTYSPRRQKGFFTLDNLRSRRPAQTLVDLRVALQSALKMRKFAVTAKGFFVLVPRGAEVGDTLVVFNGACVPFAVRHVTRMSEAGRYELLGEAYVHGVMGGEIMHDTNVAMEDITLV